MKKFTAREIAAYALALAAMLAFVVTLSRGAIPAPGGRWFASVAGKSGQARPQKFSTEFFGTFDTVVMFTAFANDEAEFETYLDAVRGEMTRLHRLFDIYGGYDGLVNIKTLNETAGRGPVKAAPEILDLLETAKAAYRDTGGAVNVALGPVLLIWHDCRERARAKGTKSEDAVVPSYAELSAASAHISPDDIEIDRGGSTVRLRYPDMRLDVGAIAKGFAVQRAIERARDAGLESGLINAGGNVAVIGLPLDGREAWSIGVQAPDWADGADAGIIDVLSLTKGAVVTSGNYQRYFISGGVRYHHIIDPKTLFPAKGVKTVTVLHLDSTAADVLSTAAFILPYPEARAMLASHGVEAMWVMEDGRRAMTDGYRRLSKGLKSDF
jgi:thiamine biosynthesis lipoprotein